ncbi:MAG: globin [Paludibacter sp.]|nr:globin [Paludibacter sp.]
MDLQINSYQFGERPAVTKPDPEFYKQLGEEGIRKMVSRHYDLLRVSPIKHLFSNDDAEFEQSKQNSADFMIQICGGPDYFNQHKGKPMLVDRHAQFRIKPEGRIVWLNCYKQALLELDIPENLVLSFWNYINVFSAWMVNTPSTSFDVNTKL